MSSLRYMEGETKKRPGMYNRYSNADAGIAVAGATNGVGAIVITSNWGPLNEVKKFEGPNIAAEVSAMYGAEGNGPKSVLAFIRGGLNTVYVYRAGSGGTKSSVQLDSAIKIEAKYPGTRVFNVTVRNSLVDASKKEMLLFEGTTLLQKFEFASTAKDLSDAIATAGSEYITATVTTADTAISAVNTSAMTAGTNPTTTNESYSDGFTALEPYDYTVITIDSHNKEIQALLNNYAIVGDEYGNRFIAVEGTYDDVKFEDKCSASSNINMANVCYCGSGYLNANNEEIGKTEGDTRANAIMAGLIASAPTSGSVVHRVIPGATDVLKKLTHAQYETAIDSGLMLLSVGSNGEVWFDNGVTTLVNPSENQDDGWKKVKRVKIRYELMDRLDKTLEPFIGRINASETDTVLQAGLKVIDTMIAENKLLSGTMTLSKSSSDSVWYDVTVVDADTLEKIYIHYRYRYSQNN